MKLDISFQMMYHISRSKEHCLRCHGFALDLWCLSLILLQACVLEHDNFRQIYSSYLNVVIGL